MEYKDKPPLKSPTEAVFPPALKMMTVSLVEVITMPSEVMKILIFQE